MTVRVDEKRSLNLIKLLEATTELGASNWLSTLPIKSQGFYLDKQSFWDALFLRYGLTVPKLPTYCVCGVSYTIEHALSCKRGGFIAIRHNEVKKHYRRDVARDMS